LKARGLDEVFRSIEPLPGFFFVTCTNFKSEQIPNCNKF
jgi:hypothetical protein